MAVNISEKYYEVAKAFILERKECSVSMIQRKFRIGYSSAARIVDRLEDEGYVSSYNGSKPRRVLK